MSTSANERAFRSVEIPAAGGRFCRHTGLSSHRHEDRICCLSQFEECRVSDLCIALAPLQFGCFFHGNLFAAPHPKVAYLWHDRCFSGSKSRLADGGDHFLSAHLFKHTELMRESVVQCTAAVCEGAHPIPRFYPVQRGTGQPTRVADVNLFEFADAPLLRDEVMDIRDARVVEMRGGEGMFDLCLFDERVESACFLGGECQRLFANDVTAEFSCQFDRLSA